MEAQGVTKEGKQQFGYVFSQGYQASWRACRRCSAGSGCNAGLQRWPPDVLRVPARALCSLPPAPP